MVNDLLDFKRTAKSLGLCDDYKHKWDNCASKEDLAKLALTINGVEFLADSIAFKWGITKEYIAKEFREFLCNTERHAVLAESGYTSEMYAMIHGGVIKPLGALNLIISCNCTIKLYDNFLGFIYVCDGSTLNIDASQSNELRLFVYGKDNNITFLDRGKGKIIVENIRESKWIK